MKLTTENEPRTTDHELLTAFLELAAWCRARDYAGHDPFDALNSRVFRATPLARSRLARLAWTQLFKRSPVNLRPLARVPAEKNPKGTAVFALAWLSRLRAARREDGDLNKTDADASSKTTPDKATSHKASLNASNEATARLRDLIDARIETRPDVVAWGYNFDWQGRAFFAPRGTPTLVPTAFAARALVEASRALGDEKYLRLARAACEFILRDLNRSDETPAEFCFSYTPLDHTRVFNASLLASETLASVGALARDAELQREAARAARYVVRRQRADGSWAYGAQSFQSWSDNFHTAFILTSLARVIDSCDQCREEFSPSLRRGFDFYHANFFRADGFPKFTPTRDYPADAHSAGASLVALAELNNLSPDAPPLAKKIAHWSLANLRDPRGFFYYQRRRTHIVRTPYMRWSQSWMLYGLARLLEMMNDGRGMMNENREALAP